MPLDGAAAIHAVVGVISEKCEARAAGPDLALLSGEVLRLKSPAIVHLKCLDTFALQGVARAIGSGGAGVRLTDEGLHAYVRPSRREREERASIDALITGELARGPEEATGDERSEIRAVARKEAGFIAAPEVLPRRSHLSTLRSFAPIAAGAVLETPLRRHTALAVALLTVGVTLGSVLARVASSAALQESQATTAPPVAALVAVSSRVAPPVAKAPSPSPAIAVATITIVGRHHHHHHSHDADATEAWRPVAEPVAAASPAEKPAPPAADETRPPADIAAAAKPAPSDDDQGVAASLAASARVQHELDDSLGAAHK